MLDLPFEYWVGVDEEKERNTGPVFLTEQSVAEQPSSEPLEGESCMRRAAGVARHQMMESMCVDFLFSSSEGSKESLMYLDQKSSRLHRSGVLC